MNFWLNVLTGGRSGGYWGPEEAKWGEGLTAMLGVSFMAFWLVVGWIGTKQTSKEKP